MRLSNLIKWPSRTQPPTANAKSYVFLVWGPSYDSFTQCISSWLEELEIPKRLAAEKLLRQEPEKASIRAILKKAEVSRTLAVFGGHGAPEALLGPPRRDGHDVVVNGAPHSLMYDEDLYAYGPSSLFAFCCAAGRKMGRWFASSDERAFLGYSDDLMFVVTNEQCSNTWRGIIHAVCSDLMKSGNILPEHQIRLRELYDAALHFFVDGEGRSNPDNVDMIMALLNHRSSLCYFKGGTRAADS